MKKNRIGIKIVASILLTCSLIVSIFILYPNNTKGFIQNSSGIIYGFWQGIFWGNRITLLPGQSARLEAPPRCTNGNANLRQDRGGVWMCFQYAIVISPVPPPPPPPPPPPNQSPTVTYNSTTNIDYNTAISNWSYGDPEGDLQSYYHIQVATDPGFSNIVYNVAQPGSGTSIQVSGLNPGITYYPRVRAANNINGWTGWSNGAAFTTLRNDPPSITEFNCNASPTGYTSARVNWNYTGSDTDSLILQLRYIRPGDSAWTLVNLPGNRNGSRDISNLIPGYGYAVQISITDIYNRNLSNRWVGCGNVTPNPYPEPRVNFTLSGGGNIRGQGETLTVASGEEIRVNWNITNTDGLERCRITTSGAQQLFTINPLMLNSSREFVGVNSITPAANLNDQNYTVRLECDGRRPANPVRSINQSIGLTIVSRPLISCTVTNTVVSKETPILNITGTVSNINRPYEWWISKNGDIPSNYTPTGVRGNSLNRQLNYETDAFGKYTPWLQIRENNGRITNQSCREITNFGDRTIREISP